jgi:hypothetical protein
MSGRNRSESDGNSSWNDERMYGQALICDPGHFRCPNWLGLDPGIRLPFEQLKPSVAISRQSGTAASRLRAISEALALSGGIFLISFARSGLRFDNRVRVFLLKEFQIVCLSGKCQACERDKLRFNVNISAHRGYHTKNRQLGKDWNV